MHLSAGFLQGCIFYIATMEGSHQAKRAILQLALKKNDCFLEILFSLQSTVFNPIHVFQKDILCFYTNGINLIKNNQILIKRENGKYPKHSNLDILEIRKDNNPVDIIDDRNSIDISVKVSEEVNKKVNFTIINLT